MAKNKGQKSKKVKSIKADVLLKEAEKMTIKELAEKYSVCYLTMQKILKELNFEAKVGRPKSLIIN